MYFKLILVMILVHYGASKLNNEDVYDPYWELLERTFLSTNLGSNVSCEDNNTDFGEPLFLTPYIKNNKSDEAKMASHVDFKPFLPGLDSYSGYLTVNEEHNSNLWFWYFPVMYKPVNETPWIIWLQGGPGVSSMYGLFQEVGPFSVTTDCKLQEREYAWSKNYSMLFIDNPVGTGFSFTDNEGYATNQTMIGENLYNMLQQFLSIFPELRQSPLFLAGESYAGKHVPSLGIQIHWNKGNDGPINLQGLAIGNGLIDPLTLMRFSFAAREIGLLDDKSADLMRQSEVSVEEYIKNKNYVKAFREYWTSMSILYQLASFSTPYNYMENKKEEIYGSYVNFLKQPKIRRAIHVGNMSFTTTRTVYGKLIPDIMNSAKDWLEELLNEYKVMLYNGHLDTLIGYHPSVNTYNSLVFNDAEKYNTTTRRAWLHEGQLAGYYKRAGNFLEVMVRGAGHMVPIDKPAEALALISAFIQDLPLTPSIPDDLI